MARPSKLSPELREQIAQLIRAGNTVETAAAAAGLSERSFYSWMERGEAESSGDYVDFRDAVEQARAESEAVLVARIAKAASSGSWQAASWLLERRFAERWAKVTERKRANSDEEAEKSVDPFAEIDELAQRRKTA